MDGEPPCLNLLDGRAQGQRFDRLIRFKQTIVALTSPLNLPCHRPIFSFLWLTFLKQPTISAIYQSPPRIDRLVRNHLHQILLVPDEALRA